MQKFQYFLGTESTLANKSEVYQATKLIITNFVKVCLVMKTLSRVLMYLIDFGRYPANTEEKTPRNGLKSLRRYRTKFSKYLRSYES